MNTNVDNGGLEKLAIHDGLVQDVQDPVGHLEVGQHDAGVFGHLVRWIVVHIPFKEKDICLIG